VGVIAPLPITKVSRKQRGAITDGIFIPFYPALERGAQKSAESNGGGALYTGGRLLLRVAVGANDAAWRKGIAFASDINGNASSPAPRARPELTTAPAYAKRRRKPVRPFHGPA